MHSSEDAKFASWAIVEVMGHSAYAGWVTTESVAGPMIRVDVPEIENRPAFTKYLSPASLFALTPCTEQTAREAAKAYRSRAVSMFEMPMLRIEREDNDDYE